MGGSSVRRGDGDGGSYGALPWKLEVRTHPVYPHLRSDRSGDVARQVDLSRGTRQIKPTVVGPWSDRDLWIREDP